MKYDDIIAEVAKETGLPKGLVDRTYKSYWKVIRQHVESLPLKEELSDDEFNKLQPNVNIPSIGKLYVTLDRYRRVKKHYNIRQEILNNKKNATHQENQTVI